MLVHRWMPALRALLVVDVLVLVAAAANGRPHLIGFGAACFVALLAAVAMAANRVHWKAGATTEAAAVAALEANVRLGTLAWLWGSIAMQGVYLTPLTGLRWQHAWQYALVMLLAAWITTLYGRRLRPWDTASEAERARSRRLCALAPALAALQAIGGAVGALFLVASGKLVTWRPDWAANQIFLFGALLIMVLGAITLQTHRRLWRHATAPDTPA